MGVEVGDWVLMHLNNGRWPALVTRVNQDGTVSLTVFMAGDITYRDGVQKFVQDGDYEEGDEVGYWRPY